MTSATGIGARVPRTEDKRFLTGTGRYVDDLPLARATYAYFLRSPHAHAKIKSIDISAPPCLPWGRKVRAPQDRTPGNAWEARAYGQCNRKQTADGPAQAGIR